MHFGFMPVKVVISPTPSPLEGFLVYRFLLNKKKVHSEAWRTMPH